MYEVKMTYTGVSLKLQTGAYFLVKKINNWFTSQISVWTCNILFQTETKNIEGKVMNWCFKEKETLSLQH